MQRLRKIVATVLACGGAILIIAHTTAQQPTTTITAPQLISEGELPGIDRGLREVQTPSTVTAMQALRARVAEYTKAYLPDSLIVKFRPGTSLTAQRAMLALVDGTSSTSVPNADFEIVTTQPGVDPEQAAARLAAQPDVEYAQARYRIRPQFVPNDPLYSRQWNFPAIDMERAWDINPGATSSITVAVLDTGIAYRGGTVRYSTTNPLAQLVFPGVSAIDVLFAAAPDLGPTTRFVSPRDFIWNTTLPLDLEGHGTHVAGTIGGLTNNGLGVAGMAFNVSIMPVKVIGGDWDIILALQGGTDDSVAQGVRYAVDNGARVLNLSIGRTGPPSPVIQSALTYAVSQGAFAAVAAGNDFLAGNPIERPADLGPQIEGVITVGAIGRTRTRASYSSTGSYVEIAAPGGDQFFDGDTGGILQQTYDFDFAFPFSGPPRFDMFTYFYAQGTSMATAHVTGFAALLMQQGITNPAAIEAAMKRYATDLGPSGRDDQFGNGLINVRATLRGMGLAK
jgi:serine protease